MFANFMPHSLWDDEMWYMLVESRYRSYHRHPLPIPPSPNVAAMPLPNPLPISCIPPPPEPEPLLPSLTALLLPFPPSTLLTPSTILSSPVSTTTPPTIISLRTACNVSKPKMRSSSHTFSKRRSSASTKTWMKSRRASGDSVEVLIIMK